MDATRNNLSATNVELIVRVPADDMLKFARQAADKISERTTIQGFRPGKAPFDMVKARVGDMAILEEASKIAVAKTIDAALKEQVNEDWIGQPQITITKLAPDNDMEYKLLVTLLPEVKLGDYKGLGLKREDNKVTDEEVEKVVDHLRESRVKEVSVDRPAENGDKLILDIQMFEDNVPLEGGQGRDAAIVLGKDNLVPGFDKEVAGIKAGDERNFFIHYPADHFQKNFAGKKIDFKVKAKSIFSRELPEVNDEFAKGFGLPNAEDMRKSIKQNLEHEKRHEADHKLEREMLESIVKKSKIAEVPDMLIEGEIETMLRELEQHVVSQGGRFEDYLSSLGKSKADMGDELRAQATERVKTALIIRAIVKAENFSVTDKEIDQELDILKQRYSNDPKALEILSSIAYRRQLESQLLNRQTISKLVSWNTSV